MSATAGRLPDEFLVPGNPSFVDFLAACAPDLLPRPVPGPETPMGGVPHGTTIVVAAYADGVVMAGDRRATMGNVIASREMEKVFPGDDFSAIGVAGTAGIAIELVRLFQLELEHYEKIEGSRLSLDGKANRLSALLRANLPLAMQGMAALPLFAGYDLDLDTGRFFSFDVTGGRYEERGFHAIGSGAVFARGALKKLWTEGLGETAILDVVLEALVDAADDDSATAGPDRDRGIWPVVVTVTADGYRRIDDDVLAKAATRIGGRRRRRSGRKGADA